jgi:hypothetical protein
MNIAHTWIDEFLYSAILWGSLITLLLWWWRRPIKSRAGRIVMALPLAWFALHTAIGWYGFVWPPSGRLIEADNGAPIRNTRVIATWISYPMSLWTMRCSGRQAHLSDDDGAFAFRYAPYPTLFAGIGFRGLRPLVPGRVQTGKMGRPWTLLRGDISFKKYAPGAKTDDDSQSVGCKVAIAPQFTYEQVNDHAYALFPGEEHPFEVMYREACIERQPSTFTNTYLDFMSGSSSQTMGAAYAKLHPDEPRILALREASKQLGQFGCRTGGVCAASATKEAHDAYCAYFSWIRELQQGGLQ